MLAFIEALGALRARVRDVFVRMDEVPETLRPGDYVVLHRAVFLGAQRFSAHVQARWKRQGFVTDTFQNLFFVWALIASLFSWVSPEFPSWVVFMHDH